MIWINIPFSTKLSGLNSKPNHPIGSRVGYESD